MKHFDRAGSVGGSGTTFSAAPASMDPAARSPEGSPAALREALDGVAAAACGLVAALIERPAPEVSLPRDAARQDDPFALLLVAEVVAVHATRLCVVAGWALEAVAPEIEPAVVLCERVVVKLARVLADSGFELFGTVLLELGLRLPAEFSTTSWPQSRSRLLELQQAIRVLDAVFCGLSPRR
jgi:hypothetical protein